MSVPIDLRIPTTSNNTASAMAQVESAQSAIAGIMSDIASLQQQIAAILKEIAALEPPDPSQFRKTEKRETGEPPNVKVETVEVFDAQAFNAKMREYQSKLAQLQSQVQGMQQQLGAKEQQLTAKENELAQAKKKLQEAMTKAPQELQQKMQERMREIAEQQAQIDRQRAMLEQAQEVMRRAEVELNRAWQTASAANFDLVDGVPTPEGLFEVVPASAAGLPDAYLEELAVSGFLAVPPGVPAPVPPTFGEDGRPLAIPQQVWQRLDPADQQAMIDNMEQAYASAVLQASLSLPEGTVGVKNPELAAFLEEHPEIETVQDLINETYPKGIWKSTCESLGLDSVALFDYRSAHLFDMAYIRQPPPGTIPTSVEEANAYHIAQFNTADFDTDFNLSYNKDGHWSNNCGPASFAMALQTMGLVPPELDQEQKIDWARALIFDTHNQEVEINGQTFLLYDKDVGEGSLTGYGQIVTGAEALDIPAHHTYGWGALDDALANGNPVVVGGTIHTGYKYSFPEVSHYGNAGEVGHFIAILGKTAEGNYIVNDPMYADGAVEMTADQVSKFTGSNPDITVIGAGADS